MFLAIMVNVASSVALVLVQTVKFSLGELAGSLIEGTSESLS